MTEEKTLCNYDKEKCCHKMTESVMVEGTHMVCKECKATK